MSRAPPTPRFSALRTALLYAAVAGLWILVSDRVVDTWFADAASLSRVQSLKGALFVACTAALLYLVVRRDLTAVAASQDELRRSEERFRHLFEAAPVSLWEEDVTDVLEAVGDLRARGVVDLGRHLDEHPEFVQEAARKVRILDVNPATLALYGAASKEALYGSLDRVFLPESYPVFRGELLALAEDRPSFECEGVNQTLGGERLHVMLGYSRVASPPGRQHIVVSVVDLTGRRRAEEERRRLEAQVQHAQKLESLGVMAGGIAHDFNNLLMAVLGNADLARLALPPESPALPRVEQIATTATRAAELTHQMLAYAGKGTFSVRPVHLNHLIDETGSLLGAVLSKKAAVSYRLAPDLPAVEGDPGQLRQVVMNLLTNASEALGGEAGEIRVSTGLVTVDDPAELASPYLEAELPPGRYLSLEVSD
ncbi:MAG: two-component system sensor histidine kinase NtrB, partial [Deferrisomatales bacterium]